MNNIKKLRLESPRHSSDSDTDESPESHWYMETNFPPLSIQNIIELRKSFKNSLQNIIAELQSLMHPEEPSVKTFNAMEEYLVELSKQANQPFEVVFTSDTYMAKISLKVDNNKVIMFLKDMNTSDEDAEEENSEGVVDFGFENVGNWIPQGVFFSNLIFGQYAEEPANVDVPIFTIIRPPPGFNSPPQYSVSNIGSPTVCVDMHGQSAVPSTIRSPPGFSRHTLTAPISSPCVSREPTPGPSASPASNDESSIYFGVADAQKILATLFKQTLEAARQNNVMSANGLNQIDAATTQLRYELMVRQVEEAGRQQSSAFSNPQGYYAPSLSTPSCQFEFPQAQIMQQSADMYANYLWEHYSNAVSNSQQNIPESGGYWANFLQNQARQQQYELFKRFEAFQKIKYSADALRMGTTEYIPTSMMLPNHGPVGYGRFRSQLPQQPQPHQPLQPSQSYQSYQSPQGRGIMIRGRAFDNNNQMRDNPRTPQQFCGGQVNWSSGAQYHAPLWNRVDSNNDRIPEQMRPDTKYQEQFDRQQNPDDRVNFLAELFRKAVITTNSSAVPQNRNAVLGSILQNRLRQRILANNAVSYSTSTSSISSAPGPSGLINNTFTPVNGRNTPTLYNLTNSSISSSGISITVEHFPCSYCAHNNGTLNISGSHVMRDLQGRVICPLLRKQVCPICNATGDNAHTVQDCAIRKLWDEMD